MNPITKKLVIRGVVHGVGFRYSMYYAAKNFNIRGWVKNCRDGSVEAIVQGSADDVERMIEWAKKGPSMSQVDFVEVVDGWGQYSTFEIQP